MRTTSSPVLPQPSGAPLAAEGWEELVALVKQVYPEVLCNF